MAWAPNWPDACVALHLPRVAVVEALGDVGLIDAWTGHDSVILLDAVLSGAAPGTVIRRDLRAAPLPRDWFRLSSHQLGVADAVELARRCGALPTRLVFVGIEGERFDSGRGSRRGSLPRWTSRHAGRARSGRGTPPRLQAPGVDSTYEIHLPADCSGDHRCRHEHAHRPARRRHDRPSRPRSAGTPRRELQAIAVVDRKVMMPMRDGVRLATDIYRPKDASKKVPTIFVRTPYNFNFWDVRNGVPGDMTAALTAVKRGYAYVVQNERGHFFSEGNYDILGTPRPTATTRWRGSRSSRGRTARSARPAARRRPNGRWASRRSGNPAYAAMNVQGFGAGVGRVAPYFEQGNWYRGGAVQMLFITWIYGEQNQVRPMFPPNTSQEDLIRASKSVRPRAADAAGRLVEGAVAPAGAGHHEGRRRAARHLRRRDAGADRRRDDPARAERSRRGTRAGSITTTCRSTCPGLYFMSWYDVSVGPNLALYNHVRKTAKGDVANQQWAVIAPVDALRLHARDGGHRRRRAQHGRRAAQLQEIIYGFFDRFLKGETSPRLDTLPKVHLLHDGPEQVAVVGHLAAARRAADDVLPRRAAARANTMNGDGALATGARRRPTARRVHLRSDEAGHVVRRQRVLHRATPSRPARSTSARWKRAPTSSSTRPSRSRRASR